MYAGHFKQGKIDPDCFEDIFSNKATITVYIVEHGTFNGVQTFLIK